MIVENARVSVAARVTSFGADESCSLESGGPLLASGHSPEQINAHSTAHSSVSQDDSAVPKGLHTHTTHDRQHLSFAPSTTALVPLPLERDSTSSGSDGFDHRSDHNPSLEPPTCTGLHANTIPSSDDLSVSRLDGDDPLAAEAKFQLEELMKKRGTGEHICPYRLKCSRGGLDKNGKPVIFGRNSDYK